MNESLSALAEFFNDFIGLVVPGAVCLTFLWMFFVWPIDVSDSAISSVGGVLLSVAIAYALGHALAAFHWALSRTVLAPLFSAGDERWYRSLDERGLVKEARQLLGRPPESKDLASDIRNRLMTVSKEANRLAVRFRHIELLCNGVGLAVITALVARLYAVYFSPELLRGHSTSIDLWSQSLVMVVVGLVLLRRGGDFRRRAIELPFTVGVEELARPTGNRSSI